MAKINETLHAFNRGIVSPLALARVDIDRIKLSAETMTNFIPKTQGAMRLRPGTKYLGSSLNDTGAAWIEFVASTTDNALLEITSAKMRVWKDDALMTRPTTTTTVSFSDTGWSNDSTGGDTGGIGTTPDQIPVMTAATTSGVTMSADSDSADAWKAGDDDVASRWNPPSNTGKLQIDFGSGQTKTIATYSIRAGSASNFLNDAPKVWILESNHNDTGDAASWTIEDTQGSEKNWSVSEKRTYTLTDTGTAHTNRIWRLNVTGNNDDIDDITVAEIELFEAPAAALSQAAISAGALTLNAHAIGGTAKITRAVTLQDTGATVNTAVEHGLAIHVARGPVTFMCGSTVEADDYIPETTLYTGYHSLSFTPQGTFHLTFKTKDLTDKIVNSIAIETAGAVTVTTPWAVDTGDAVDIDNIRYDQSADVIFASAYGKKQMRIERRGATGKSWSVVEYLPQNGPFYGSRTTAVTIKPSSTWGNTTLTSNENFFESGHVGSLFRLLHDGQGGFYKFTAEDTYSDVWSVTGVGSGTERRAVVTTTGTWTANLRVQRSYTSATSGFRNVANITTNTATNVDDTDDNVTVYYRLAIPVGDFTSGRVSAAVAYAGGGKDGVCRVTKYNTEKSVDIEVLSRFGDTGPVSDWAESKWSGAQTFPSSVALHEGRLWWFGGAQIFGSVSDDYENWNAGTVGDAGPISRTIGSGPVDRINFALPLTRLFIGSSGEEISVRSSNRDDVLTSSNINAKAVSNVGSANTRALKIDDRGLFIQRSQRRAYLLEYDSNTNDYRPSELTMLVPDLLSGVSSIAFARQPDTRIYFVMDDGTMAIVTFESQEDVLCWSLFKTTAAGGKIEKVVTLPGTTEDKVYIHVNRTINGVTKRYLERLATEAESVGAATSWMADCAVIFEDTGTTGRTAISGLSHLEGESVISWANDTGNDTGSKGVDLSPDDTGGNQTLFTVASGVINIPTDKLNVVTGLPYIERTTGKEMDGEYKSVKLAYGAQGGSALTMPKRVDHLGVILGKTHNNGLFYGKSLDVANLQRLPKVIDGRVLNDTGTDVNEIFSANDLTPVPFDGDFNSDSRIALAAKAPRPVTLLAMVIGMTTNDLI